MTEEKELKLRFLNLVKKINDKNADWDCVFILSKINQYYLTGTLQEGVLVILKDGTAIYFIRKSLERANLETTFKCMPMATYSDVAKVIGNEFNNVYVEGDIMTYATLNRIKKYIKINNILEVDDFIFKARAVKTEFELEVIKKSGKLHGDFMNNVIPGLFKEGISEADFAAGLYAEMVKHGHHGVSRFNMFQMEIIGGQFGFGENSLYPTNFDGPGGVLGLSPATPLLGSRTRKLKKGDLVFVDIAFGVEGYHTDKTQVYYFGKKPSDEVKYYHNKCLEIQKRTAELLKPESIPDEIYNSVMNSIEPEFLNGFMGTKDGKAKFLGHGVGLNVDEYPVIAPKIKYKLKENMVVALEPKRHIKDTGIVGGEDTYIVAKDGGEMITNGEKEIIVV